MNHNLAPCAEHADSLEAGLQAANEANHEFDVWQRVERASRESEVPMPEGISPADAHNSFLAKLVIGGELIGRESDATMTPDGLRFSDKS